MIVGCGVRWLHTLGVARRTSISEALLKDPAFRAKIDDILNKEHLDDHEQRAGELLEAILKAERWVPRDLPDVDGMHDLDLVMADDSRIAVEVTTHTAGNRAAFMTELERHNPIAAGSLTHHWQIDVDVPANQWRDSKSVQPLVGRIRNELESILRLVEQDDLFEEVRVVRPGTRRRPAHPLSERLRELKIVAASALDIGNSGEIWIQPPHTGAFSFHPNQIAQIASEHIGAKKDKLLRAKENGAAEAHLLVWSPVVVSRSPGAAAAIWTTGDDDPITAEVDLQGLDAVWVTSSGTAAHAEIHGHCAPVHRYDKTGWQTYTLAWEATPR